LERALRFGGRTMCLEQLVMFAGAGRGDEMPVLIVAVPGMGRSSAGAGWRTTGLDEAWRVALHAVAMRSGARREAARKRVNRMKDSCADIGEFLCGYADCGICTRILVLPAQETPGSGRGA
jgi:hypothetical protein